MIYYHPYREVCKMRKVELRMNEEYKYTIIKNLADNNGNKKMAATKLKCSIRTINRLLIKYNTSGKAAFIHGNRNRTPSNAFSDDTKKQIIQIYTTDYYDTNFRHFCEIIKEDNNITISDSTLNKWLRELYILSPKARKKTRKQMRKQIKKQLHSNSSKQDKNIHIHTLDAIDAHPRRPRCKYMGEMIQMDASSFFWLEGKLWHLHLAIDDASGAVVGAYLDTQETLKGYYHVFYQILTNYGIPAMFYTDRRTIFEYKRKNTAFDDDDTFTQFSYACHQLGVTIQTTSVAQAKGRIERLNQTFQSRLPVELRRHNIQTIEQANEFLKSYLKKYNALFALQLNTTKSVYEKQPKEEILTNILSVITTRKIHGHCFKYKNRYYIPITKSGVRMYFKNKSDAMIIESFNGKQYVNVLDELYCLEHISDFEEYSKTFDYGKKTKKKKKQYIPPMSHPWKHASYLKYCATMKHRQSNANV